MLHLIMQGIRAQLCYQRPMEISQQLLERWIRAAVVGWYMTCTNDLGVPCIGALGWHQLGARGSSTGTNVSRQSISILDVGTSSLRPLSRVAVHAATCGGDSVPGDGVCSYDTVGVSSVRPFDVCLKFKSSAFHPCAPSDCPRCLVLIDCALSPNLRCAAVPQCTMVIFVASLKALSSQAVRTKCIFPPVHYAQSIPQRSMMKKVHPSSRNT